MLDYLWIIPAFPLLGVVLNAFLGYRLGRRFVNIVGPGVVVDRPRCGGDELEQRGPDAHDQAGRDPEGVAVKAGAPPEQEADRITGGSRRRRSRRPALPQAIPELRSADLIIKRGRTPFKIRRDESGTGTHALIGVRPQLTIP